MNPSPLLKLTNMLVTGELPMCGISAVVIQIPLSLGSGHIVTTVVRTIAPNNECGSIEENVMAVDRPRGAYL